MMTASGAASMNFLVDTGFLPHRPAISKEQGVRRKTSVTQDLPLDNQGLKRDQDAVHSMLR